MHVIITFLVFKITFSKIGSYNTTILIPKVSYITPPPGFQWFLRPWAWKGWSFFPKILWPLLLLILCNKDSGAWDISTDSTLLGSTDNKLKSLFFPISSIFSAILCFWGSGKKFLIFNNSVCTSYCTQNDRLDPTVSMQKSVWKTNHHGSRYLQKCF